MAAKLSRIGITLIATLGTRYYKFDESELGGDVGSFYCKIASIPNVYGLEGSPLANSPLFQGNMRLRYEFPPGEYKAFTPAGGVYYGASWSAVGPVDNYHMGGYGTCDASAGVAKDAWNVRSPIFVVALPRSGSTLLEQILAFHSQVEGTMELADIPRLVRELQGRETADSNPRYPGGTTRCPAGLCEFNTRTSSMTSRVMCGGFWIFVSLNSR